MDKREIESAKSLVDTKLNKDQNPVVILGADFYNYDKFCDWLDIADEEEDFGLQSLKDTLEVFKKFKHDHHVKIIEQKIKKIQ